MDTATISQRTAIRGHDQLKRIGALPIKESPLRTKIIHSIQRTLSKHDELREVIKRSERQMHKSLFERDGVAVESIPEMALKAAQETFMDELVDVDVHRIKLTTLYDNIPGLTPEMVAPLAYWYVDDIEDGEVV